MAYVSAKEMMQDAKQRGYAVGHFNLKFIRAFQLAA